MTFASEVSIKVSTSAENRLWNIYFPGLPRHDEMISFPWRRVLIGRDADDLYQRLMTNMAQWLCVGSGDEWGEPGKMGPRAQRLAYISFHPPWLFHPNFFFLPLNGLFSPVCPHELCKCLWNPFFPWPEEEKIEVREMPPPHFFLFLTLPLNNLSCWQCGPGFQLCSHVKGWWWLLSWWRGRVRAQWHIRGTEEAGRERMPSLLLDGLTLINEREKDREWEERK